MVYVVKATPKHIPLKYRCATLIIPISADVQQCVGEIMEFDIKFLYIVKPRSPIELRCIVCLGTSHNKHFSLKILTVFIMKLFTNKHGFAYNIFDHFTSTLEHALFLNVLMF